MLHFFPLLVLLHLQFQLVGRDHSVFISVLVFKHVDHDLLHRQTGLDATFALFDLQLDELRKLETVKEEYERINNSVEIIFCNFFSVEIM